MGNFSKSITARIKHTRIKEGYCLICGEFGKLSQDHVPPKGSITIEPVEQRHITELMSGEPTKLKGVRANHGSTFRTICSKCNNNALGANDDEIARVYAELTEKIRTNFYRYDGSPNTIRVKLDALKYTRAMIGHILAATSVIECKEPPVETPYFSPLQRFVLGDDTAIESTHDIFYWFYPHRRHLSARIVGFYNEGVHCMMSLLSFFPIAFLITEKGKGSGPAQARKLNLSDDELIVNLSLNNEKYIEFPFCAFEGNRFMGLSDCQCVMSYPIAAK